MRLLPYQLPASRFSNNFWPEQLAHLEIAVSSIETAKKVTKPIPRPKMLFSGTVPGKVVDSFLGKGFHTAAEIHDVTGCSKKNITDCFAKIAAAGYKVTVMPRYRGALGRPGRGYKIEKG